MPDTTRKWELFPGRNKFCLDGRIIMGPDVNVFYINVFLIVGTTLLFFIFDCPYLTINVSPLIPVVALILFVFVMSALLRTSFTDPGIIPRATSEEAIYIEKQIKNQNCGDNVTDRPPPRTKEVIIKGQLIKLKYCFTCRIFRPPRASHCSLCDNCVEHFDHHCPWVGNCVGRRNYRYFYLFTVSLSIYIAFVFVCTCAHLYYLSEKRILFDAISDSPTSIIVLLVTFFSCWSVFGLAGFHTYLTASNQTTNEDIKGSFASKRGGSNRNPYSLNNVCLNCCYVLCGPTPSSLIDRRGYITPDLLQDKNAQEKQLTSAQTIYSSLNIPTVYNNNNYSNSSPLQAHQNNFKFASSCEKDRTISFSSQSSGIATISPSASHHCLQKTALSPSNSNSSNSQSGTSPMKSNYTTSTCEVINEIRPSNKLTKACPIIDVSKIDLDLDDILSTTATVAEEKADSKASSTLVVPLSASRLQLLQDTTMIESALDLDSLEESTSSVGANSHAGLIKKKDTL